MPSSTRDTYLHCPGLGKVPHVEDTQCGHSRRHHVVMVAPLAPVWSLTRAEQSIVLSETLVRVLFLCGPYVVYSLMDAAQTIRHHLTATVSWRIHAQHTATPFLRSPCWLQETGQQTHALGDGTSKLRDWNLRTLALRAIGAAPDGAARRREVGPG